MHVSRPREKHIRKTVFPLMASNGHGSKDMLSRKLMLRRSSPWTVNRLNDQPFDLLPGNIGSLTQEGNRYFYGVNHG